MARKPCYDVQHFSSRERYHPRPLSSYAVMRISAVAAAKIAKWCETREQAEAWIAAHGERF